MSKMLLVAVIGSLAATATAFAAPLQNEGPEPYSAPDPVYTSHKIDSSVNFKNDKPVISTSEGQSPQLQSSDHS